MKLLKLPSPSWIARTRRLRKTVFWHMEPERGSDGTATLINHRAALEAEAKDIGAKCTQASIEQLDTKSATAPAKVSGSVRN